MLDKHSHQLSYSPRLLLVLSESQMLAFLHLTILWAGLKTPLAMSLHLTLTPILELLPHIPGLGNAQPFQE